MRASVWLGLVALVGCRRASDERLDSPEPRIEPRDTGFVEHVLPSVALPAPATGPIGTAHPTTVVAAATNARWVAVCQARQDTNRDGTIEVTFGHHGDLNGDFMRPYLIRGGGDGQAIEELVAISPDERWLAIMRGGALFVIDDIDGREIAITDADLRPDQRGFGRIATFDAQSKRLVYFRANAPGTIVIRDLAQPRERVVRMPGVRAWRVFAEDGAWARFRFVRDDTDKNGTLDWPTVNTNAPIGDVCRGPALSYSTFGGGGDDTLVAWLDLDRGTLREDPAVLAHVGKDELVRAPDHSLRLGAMTLVPASCNAMVNAVLAAPVRVVVVCGEATNGERLPVEVFGPGVHVTLDVTSKRQDDGRPPLSMDSPIFCPSSESCFDLVTGARIAMNGSKVETHGTALLSRDGGHMYWMATPTAKALEVSNIDGYYPNATAGSIAALDKGIVDIATGRVLGYAPTMPLAVDLRGRVLVPDDDSGYGLPIGPLHWADPLPQPPPKPAD